MGSQDLRKDMTVLVKMIRKLGNKICDKGTYEERDRKHLFIKFQYQTKPFRQGYPRTPGGQSSVRRAYADTYKNLLKIGIKDNRFRIRYLTGVDDVDNMISEMFSLLDTIPTTIRDDVSQSVRLYLKEVDKLSPNHTKPYKKKISYVMKTGKKVSYEKCFVFGRKLAPNGKLVDGYISVREGIYLEALHFWQNIKRSK